MPLISIIIPCYNAEKTIGRCLTSILDNEIRNIEIICVDDRSTDSTNNIITAFQNNDERVQLITKKTHTNAGDTRNYGIKKAKGEYCWFIDADDLIESVSFEVLFEYIYKFDRPDLMIFKSKRVTHNGIIENESDINERYCSPYEVIEIKDIKVENYFQFTGPVIWNKLFKKKVIIDNQIFFQSIVSSNDIYFSRAFMCCIENLCFIKNHLYLYVMTNTNSISANRGNNYRHTVQANALLRKFINNDHKSFSLTHLKSYKSNLKYELCNSKSYLGKIFLGLHLIHKSILIRLC